MNVGIIIPSRLKSSRLPEKALIKICDREMILHVCDRLESLNHDKIVATDSEIIRDVVVENGYIAIMTGECETGTDRVYEIAKNSDYDIIINVQGDEPAINKTDIENVIEFKKQNMGYIIGTKAKIKKEDIINKNVVKVLEDGTLTRDVVDTEYRQQGVYAFTLQELEEFVKLKGKEVEGIELTRINKDKIKFTIIEHSQAVDVFEDIEKIEKIIRGI